MSEDVSAQVRLGCTIILVAAVVAAVLNLMVVAQSILSSGMSTLQSGTEQIALQEFEKYNNARVSGTEVKSAMSLYQGRDITVCVSTKLAQGSASSRKTYVYGPILIGSSSYTPSGGEVVYYFPETLKPAEGAAVITKEYDMDSGILDYCYNTKNTITTGQDEFILESGKFQAQLIENASGSIIGIYFKQII